MREKYNTDNMPKRVKTNYNSLIIGMLKEKPIAFNPALARVAGSALAGLFLSQLLYWWGKGLYSEWIYKTIIEFHSETLMTRGEQDRAIRIWKNLGILEVKLKGIPRRRFFHINTNKLVALLRHNSTTDNVPMSANQFAKSNRLDCEFEQANTESTSRDYKNRNVSEQESDPRLGNLGIAQEFLSKKFSI